MNRKDVLFAAGGVLLGILAMLVFFQRRDFQPPSAEEKTEKMAPSTKVATETTPKTQTQERSSANPHFPSIRQINETRAERERLLEEYSSRYYDPERVHDRSDSEYRKKVFNHHRIGDYLHSKRKDDPAFREIICLLLEHGYGIEEWTFVVGTLGRYKMELAMFERTTEEGSASGTIPPEAMESRKWALEELRERQEKSFPELVRHLKGICKITNTNLVKKLWEVDIGLIEPGDGSLGEGKPAASWGDRLLTDEDWLTEEFREARGRFDGTPPERFPYHEVDQEFANDGVRRGSIRISF